MWRRFGGSFLRSLAVSVSCSVLRWLTGFVFASLLRVDRAVFNGDFIGGSFSANPPSLRPPRELPNMSVAWRWIWLPVRARIPWLRSNLANCGSRGAVYGVAVLMIRSTSNSGTTAVEPGAGGEPVTASASESRLPPSP